MTKIKNAMLKCPDCGKLYTQPKSLLKHANKHLEGTGSVYWLEKQDDGSTELVKRTQSSLNTFVANPVKTMSEIEKDPRPIQLLDDTIALIHERIEVKKRLGEINKLLKDQDADMKSNLFGFLSQDKEHPGFFYDHGDTKIRIYVRKGRKNVKVDMKTLETERPDLVTVTQSAPSLYFDVVEVNEDAMGVPDEFSSAKEGWETQI